uniref:hypothetical protein n=1 Tax=Nocardioides sp. TaxID=35761 RepID=UPI002B2749FD
PPSLTPPKLFGRRRPATTPPAEATQGDTQVLPEVETDPAFTDPAFTDAGSEPAGAVHGGEPEATPTARTPRLNLSALASLPAALSHGAPRHVGAPAAGLLTGVALLGFIWVGLRGCDAVGTTSTCSPGSGLTALVVIFALTVLVGRVLLGLLKVREPVMTSFFAVGLTCLVAVLGPGWLIDSAATVVLVPLLSAGAFALASWVAALEVDLDD